MTSFQFPNGDNETNEANVGLGPGGQDFSSGFVTSTNGTRKRLAQWMADLQSVDQLLTSIQVSGPPSIQLDASIGNNVPSKVLANYIGTSTLSTEWESLVSIQFVVATGLGSDVPTSGNKVGEYIAVQVNPGGGNSWVSNMLLYLAPGSAPYGGQQIQENDMANYAQPYGVGIGVAGLAQPAVIGVQYTGISRYPVSAALAILGQAQASGGSPVIGLWNAGIIFANNSTNEVSILDENSSNVANPVPLTGIKMLGTKGYGLDCGFGGFTGAPIRIRAGAAIVSLNAANNADVRMIELNGSNHVYVGFGTVTEVGQLWTGTFTPGFLSPTGYITINDAAGVSRRLLIG